MHLGEPQTGPAHLARLSGLPGLGVADRLVTEHAVATWCQRPGVRVTIKPVLDLATHQSCQGYVPSPALRDQVHLLSPTGAFPHCTVPAEACDLDHIIPWDAGGTTSTDNLAPLCRLHHRVKMNRPGIFGGHC